MASDDQAKTDLLRELETLRAQLSDPAGDDIGEERIPLLLDRVEQAVGGIESEDSAEHGEAALRAAYQSETHNLQTSETELVELAIARLKEDRQLIDEVLAEVPLDQAATEQAPSQHSPSQHSPTQQAPSESPLAPDQDTPEQEPLFHEQLEPAQANHKPRSSPAETRPVARGENPFLPKHIRDRLQERRQALADDIAQAANFFPGTDNRSAPKLDQAKPAAAHQQLIDELVASYLPRIERDLRARLAKKLAQGELDLKQPPERD